MIDTIVAGFVIYLPDIDHLAKSVEAIAATVKAVVIVANSPLTQEAECQLAGACGATPLVLVQCTTNIGLGAAYNLIVAGARDLSAERVLLLDQDSRLEARDLAALDEALTALHARGIACAAIGPQPLDRSGGAFKLPAALADLGMLRAVPFVISSGTLFDLAKADRIGPFREDFFIDAVDIEWCYRAQAAGLEIFRHEGVAMTHELGRGVIDLPFGLRLTDQPAPRLYTYMRNQLAMLRLAHVPARHKLAFLVSLPLRCTAHLLAHRGSRACRLALALGLVHGARGTLGSPLAIWERLKETPRRRARRSPAGSSALKGSRRPFVRPAEVR